MNLYSFVLDISGLTLTINVNQDDTIIDVKKLIQHKTGININDQRIMYEGKELVSCCSDNKLIDYNIMPESTLSLSLALKGGNCLFQCEGCCLLPTSDCPYCCFPCMFVGCFWNSTIGCFFTECCQPIARCFPKGDCLVHESNGAYLECCCDCDD